MNNNAHPTVRKRPSRPTVHNQTIDAFDDECYNASLMPKYCLQSCMLAKQHCNPFDRGTYHDNRHKMTYTNNGKVVKKGERNVHRLAVLPSFPWQKNCLVSGRLSYLPLPCGNHFSTISPHVCRHDWLLGPVLVHD